MSDFNAVLPSDIIRGAGVLYINGTTPFGASDGSLNFDPGKTIQNTEYDGKITDHEGLDYVVEYKPVITGTFFPLSTAKMSQYEPGSTSELTTGLLADATLAIDVVPEKFQTTTVATYRIAGTEYTKAATTALTFSAAHKVAALKFGVVLIQIDAAGAISTKVAQVTQIYATAAAALAAKPAPDTGKVELGHIAIAAGALEWTANTDDLTNGSDLTTAAFVDVTILVNGITTVTPKSAAVEFTTGDYLDDVRLVFPRSSGGYAWVKFEKGLITKWSIAGKNKSEAKVSIEVGARLPAAAGVNDAPFVVEFADAV